MGFETRNPDFQQRVADSFQRQQFMATIGAKLTSVNAGQVEIQLPYSPDLSQQHGYFHGGVIGTIADNCCGYAAFTLLAATDSLVTAEYKLNLLAPGIGDRLIGRGEVIKAGKSLAVCRADVFVVKDGSEALCATALGSIAILHNRPDQQAA